MEEANIIILLQVGGIMELYIGVDISKSRLDIDWLGTPLSFDNNDKGIKSLIRKLEKLQHEMKLTSLIFEASGGYEKTLVRACHEASIPVHVAHANKVRAFARSKGLLAKTDKLDAVVLSEYGAVMKIQSDSIILSENAEKIRGLLVRREQLINDRQRERNRLDKIHDKDIKTSIKSHIKWLDKQIENIDKKSSEYCQTQDVKPTHDLLTSIPSIGDLTANHLIANLPELGKISHKAAAALVGVAPYNRDSGNFRGKRYIQGGRGQLRRVLYMAAIVSVRCNRDMAVFYHRLKASGKPSKVAIIAVIRKLLTVINSVIRRQTPWQEKIAENMNIV